MHGGLTLRLAVTCALFTLMLSAAFAAILVSVYQLRDSVLVVSRAERAVTAASNLERLVLDVEAGRRGYALTHDPALLGPWAAAQKQIPARQLELAASVVGDDLQAGRVVQLNSDVIGYLDDYADPSVPNDPARDPANIDAAAILEGQRQIAALRTQFDQFTVSQRRTVEISRAAAMQAGVHAILACVVGFITSLLAVTLLTRSLAVLVVRPLHRLVAAADKVAGGDLGVRVAADGPVEIGSMQRTFNSMVDALERGRSALSKVAAEQAALRRVATVAARGQPPGAVFNAVTEEAGKLFNADATVLVRFEPAGEATVVASWSADPAHHIAPGKVPLQGDDISDKVLRSGDPIRIEGPQSADFLAREYGDASIRSAIGAPVLIAGNIWGMLKALSTREQPLLERDADRAAQFTELVASAIANSQARADLTASRARVVAATDETRRRIERDLHDGTQQRLIALLLALRATETQADARLRDRLHTIGGDLNDAIDELRELARGIHPSILTEGGLAPALKSLARRSPIPVETRLDLPARLDTKVEIGVYYVVAEALTNAVRHARAKLICVRAEIDDGRLVLSIDDDGVGGADPATGTGLVGLNDRVAALGGTMRISSRVGSGTKLDISIPVSTAPGEGDAG